MGAVASFVEDVGDAIGDVVESVGDVVEDVVDVVVDVVEGVGDVVQAVIDDPLPVLIAIGGQMVGIPAPLTMGALTAARGGDLEDIALSMGTAYFAPSVGSSLSSTFSSTLIETGMNEAFSQTVSQSVSQGLVNGTVAEIKGGSFEDGFAGGFTGGMVAGGVGEVASYVKPDIVELAMESGLDLQEANSMYNAGTRAFSSGVSAEVTGRGDFATAFSNSAVGSSIDAGTRSLNGTIDEQFKTAATDWNEKEQNSEAIDLAISGAGIPDDVVGEVEVSSIGVDTAPSTTDASGVLASEEENIPSVGETAVSDVAVMPEQILAEAPTAESDVDFAGLLGSEPLGAEDAIASQETPEGYADLAEELPESEDAIAAADPFEPKGALASLAETPSVDLGSFDQPAVVSDAPLGGDLLKTGLASEEPVGGLNAVAQVTPEQKMADAQGLKPTDFTKPLVATVGNMLKQTLTQKKAPVRRAPTLRPAGGLQVAKVAAPKPAAPRMDIAKLMPIQKATVAPQTAPAPRMAPPKTLASGAKLSPVTDIASLTSLVKKAG